MGAIPSNLLAYNSESMETSAASWQALANCTVAQTVVRGVEGVAALRLTCTAIGNCTAICNTANQPYPLVTVGRSYQWSYWVWLSAALNVTPVFDWYNGTTFVSTATAAARAVPSSVWTFVGFITPPAPATTTLARVYPAFTSTAASGQTADIDEIFFGPAGPNPSQLGYPGRRLIHAAPSRHRDAAFAR